MPSTPLRQMYKQRQFIRNINSQAEKDKELDHKDPPPPLTLQHWKLQSYNSFMKIVLGEPKKEMNSYHTPIDEHINLLPFQMKYQLQSFQIHMVRQWVKYPTHIRHSNMNIQPPSVKFLQLLPVTLPTFIG